MKQTLLKLSRAWKCSAYYCIATFINIIKLSALRAQFLPHPLPLPSILSLLWSLHWNYCSLFFSPLCHLPQICNRASLPYAQIFPLPILSLFCLIILILRRTRMRTFIFTCIKLMILFNFFRVTELFLRTREDLFPLFILLLSLSFSLISFVFNFVSRYASI